jgi:tetratricopeptide (TPR) repeat protein
MRLAAVVMVVAALAPAALGQELREAARQHFDQGKREFDAGRFEAALVEFHEAYTLAPYPQLLYNIARCQEELHHARDAVDSYDRYLAVNTSDVEARTRADALRAAAAAEPPRPPPESKPNEPPQKLEPTIVIVAPPPPPRPTPLYKKWWLWTAVAGVVVVGAGIGLGVGLTRAPAAASFPPLTAQ